MQADGSLHVETLSEKNRIPLTSLKNSPSNDQGLQSPTQHFPSKYLESYDAVNGTRVELPCHIEIKMTAADFANVSWLKMPRRILTRGALRITRDHRIHLLPQSVESTSEFPLVIDPIREQDAGEYRCLVQIGSKLHHKVVILVVKDIFVRGGLLVFSQVRRQMTGRYFCEGRNGIPPSVISESRLLVRCKCAFGYQKHLFPDAPEVKMSHTELQQYLGRSTIIGCTIQAYPVGNVEWELNGIPIHATHCEVYPSMEVKYCQAESTESKPTSKEKEMLYRFLESRLIVTNITHADLGVYTCRMRNTVGVGEDYTRLEAHFEEPLIGLHRYSIRMNPQARHDIRYRDGMLCTDFGEDFILCSCFILNENHQQHENLLVAERLSVQRRFRNVVVDLPSIMDCFNEHLILLLNRSGWPSQVSKKNTDSPSLENHYSSVKSAVPVIAVSVDGDPETELINGARFFTTDDDDDYTMTNGAYYTCLLGWNNWHTNRSHESCV
ncbi:neurotracting/lsamp/neurotrimin/obcam related cell adhesion molecule [Clonorchis sinensis]|uniref:Neurotracting/lsamp/neurotrimin/obcam related cell adhesion molecule n=1 Tax=Clonorchis sinensis TaxID=79923 RepID=G7Y6F1_CLOSI|nr:neurotracting/lsamp/neurotrimin/obcam related cell adhesion molecule [Clonorchis sinensis]